MSKYRPTRLRRSCSADCTKPRERLRIIRQYDYILVNEKVESAIDILQAIVKAERLKRSGFARRPEDELVLAAAQTGRAFAHDRAGADDPGNI